MTCCITAETIQHIYDTQTMEDGAISSVVPVITQALDSWGYYDSFTQLVHDRIWQDYRYRMISSCDVDYWVECLGDYLAAISLVYCERLQVTQNVLTDGLEVGGIRTSVYGAREDENNGVSEDMPDTSTPLSSSYTYPATRSKSKLNKGEQTDTHTDESGTSEHLRKFYENTRDPLDDMMKDISKFWLNRW